jgi:dTDP-glucose 4,6-dehydratase
VKTNVIGTMNLLNAAKTIWKDSMEGKRFYHISRRYMEVWVLKDCLQRLRHDPNSPYSASKASFILCAYGETYGLPYVLTNCSNYGPFTFQKIDSVVY